VLNRAWNHKCPRAWFRTSTGPTQPRTRAGAAARINTNAPRVDGAVLHAGGTEGSSPASSSKESANFQSLEPEAFTDAVFGVPTVNAFRYLHRCLKPRNQGAVVFEQEFENFLGLGGLGEGGVEHDDDFAGMAFEDLLVALQAVARRRPAMSTTWSCRAQSLAICCVAACPCADPLDRHRDR